MNDAVVLDFFLALSDCNTFPECSAPRHLVPCVLSVCTTLFCHLCGLVGLCAGSHQVSERLLNVVPFTATIPAFGGACYEAAVKERLPVTFFNGLHIAHLPTSLRERTSVLDEWL